jgi:N-acetylmuramoyl-L-alanine amidase
MEQTITLEGKEYIQTIKPVEKVNDRKVVPKKSAKIVLEVGHGESDPGAIDPRTGTTEYTLNLLVCDSARGFLAGLGYENILVSDMKGRLSTIGYELSREAEVFVSVHHNCFNQKAQYTLGLVSPKGNAEDARLADIFATKASEFLGFQKAKVREMGLSILSGALYERPSQLRAAFLAEGYFLDAPLNTRGGYEWKSLRDASRKYGEALAFAIDEFLS